MTCFGSCVTAIALGSSTGFGAELLSDSLRFSGQIRMDRQKVLWNDPPRLPKFRMDTLNVS